ncbi:MAG TPA: excinuclease ABC subunit UvrC [Vicinamibacterales bacterium]|jgi:excinuclease ABC subunit C|nr:excinuclease ABC subunit UvrC [Vicinamibacterales bacterium]
MPIQDLKEQIARLPEQPGVYLWGNRGGETVYVGKARSLRDRVRSYLGAWGMSPRHDALLDEIATLEVIVTDSVMEALALENNLIKQRSPKYNILLRDDKNYPYLRLTTSEAFPRLLVARSVDEKDGDFYAGPFLPAKLGRRTMVLSHRLFGLRSCNEVINGRRGRPCLEYDIKRCIAPCVAELCTEERYAEAVANTELLLEGRTEELADTLRERMQSSAEAERFEEAAQLRDALRTVQTLAERQQKLATPQTSDRDVFGLKVGPSGGVVQAWAMRGGRVVERVELAIEAGAVAGGDADVMGAVLGQFYERRVPPPEIDLPVGIEDDEAVAQWLSVRAGRKVRLLVPQRGDRRALVELATRNAELSYRTRHNEIIAAHFEALETLRAVLALKALPRRIECFDISTIQGAETVASMVVCEDGRMKKSDYRKFRIRHLPEKGPDDFAAMREVVQRRYRAVLEAGGPFPDLILIDGGPGQVSAAYEALETVGLGNLEAVGIAKREELLVPRQGEPIALPPNDPALLLVQRIRDEAHRFAVTFHRKARSMRDLRSELDDVPGVGPRRRRALLRAFGSLSAVRRATREELTSVVGAKVASAVIDHFARSA